MPAAVPDLPGNHCRSTCGTARIVIDDTGASRIGARYHKKLSTVTIRAGLVPEERMDRFVAHLDNENEFKRPCRVPSTAYDHPEYQADGGYWRGAIWAPTKIMNA